MRALLPGPYTLVLPNPARRYPWLNGASPETIGVRVPLLPERDAARARRGRRGRGDERERAGRAGGGEPRRGARRAMREGCGAEVDAGRLPGVASTVLDFTGEEPRVLREGAAPSAEALARVAALDDEAAVGETSTIDLGPDRGASQMAIAQETFEQLRTAGLAEIDPEIADAARPRARAPARPDRADRVRELHVAVRARGRRLDADEQVRRGLPGQALLRRLRGRRRDRGARARPREGALRRRARERAAACRRAGEHGRLLRGAPAGRQGARPLARPRRPPHARAQGQLLREALRVPPLRRLARDDDWSTTTRCSRRRRRCGRS